MPHYTTWHRWREHGGGVVFPSLDPPSKSEMRPSSILLTFLRAGQFREMADECVCGGGGACNLLFHNVHCTIRIT
jgi:hypothetical protein